MSASTGSSPADSPRSETTRALRERAAEEALRAISSVPPLAVLAVGAALVELLLARVIWHGLGAILDVPVLLELRRLARFPRNLAAVAGLAATVAALVAFLRLPGYAPIGRRLTVAAFSGVFLPCIAVAALQPAASLQKKLVLFGLAAANVLVTLVALTAARYRPERLLRAAVWLASMSAFVTLIGAGLGHVTNAQGGIWGSVGAVLAYNPQAAETVLLVLRHAGELSWLGVLVACGVATVWDRGSGNVRARIAFAIVLTIALGAALALLHQAIGYRFRFLLFGSFRLGALVDALPVAYAVPLAIGLAGGVSGVVRTDSSLRQMGAGTLVWLCAGFAPHTPIQMLYLVLGALLLARAAQARDATGSWRTHQPWTRLTGTRAKPAESSP